MNAYEKRSEIYGLEYIEKRDFSFIQSFLTDPRMNVLEAPCGAGRLSKIIAPEVNHLTVVDLERTMIDATVSQLTVCNLAHKVSAIVGDMRSVFFPTLFDLIIIPREALQLFTQSNAREVLVNFCKHLHPLSGRMIVDMANFNEGALNFSLLDHEPDYYYRDIEDGVRHKNWTRSAADGSQLTRWSTQKHSKDRIDFYLEYECLKPPSSKSWFAEMTLYRHSMSWVESALPHDLAITETWGNYDRSPYSENCPRIIISLKRKAHA